MKTKITFLPILIFLLSHASLDAQIGRCGINTTTSAAMLHVKDSSVVFTGVNYHLLEPPPVSGPGLRMMWYPQRAAFRAGYVDGQQWDRDSIGLYSFASGGRSPKASGTYSVAMGDYTTASGDFSVSIGGGNKATGSQSVALGSLLVASGFSSTAFGNSCIASGSASTTFGNTTKASGHSSTAAGTLSIASGTTSFAMGNRVNARSFSSFVVGSFNDTTNVGGFGGWVSTDPIFIVGNGQSEASRQNALTVLKNGKTG